MPPGFQYENLGLQVIFLFLLAIPVACISWTITHEEIFREPREYCVDRSKNCRWLFQRKLFYMLTCEFCLSHYVSAGWLALTRFHLLFSNWLGYAVALFSLVWVANLYMAIFGRLRLEIQTQRLEIEEEKRELGQQDKQPDKQDARPAAEPARASRERKSAA